MLHRLFSSNTQRLRTDADLRSHFLLHGDSSESNANVRAGDCQLVIAQDLGDKTKVVLFDSLRGSDEKFDHATPASQRPDSASQAGKKTSPRTTSGGSNAELITELMFGTVPLSYRGTSVRVHLLPTPDETDQRTFLFTKVFTVNVTTNAGSESPHNSTSGNTSLSSSYGSISALREYPFPTMTPIQSESLTKTPGSMRTSLESRGRDPVLPLNGGNLRMTTKQNARLPTSSLVRHHQRAPSGGNRSDLGDAAPYVPFTKSENCQTHDDFFSGWLPSPGPVLSRCRRSIDTGGSTSPGSTVNHGRYQPAMCAIAIIFTVPGNGQEDKECAMMTRHWQMITRATYALQRIVYDEIELALNFVTAHGTIQTPRSRHRCNKGEAQIIQHGKKLFVSLNRNCLADNHKVLAATTDFKSRVAGGINLPEIQHKSLESEATILMDELSAMTTLLDRKETHFIFSTLMTQIVDYLAASRLDVSTDSFGQKNSLRNRIVIVSDDVVLARRLIFCIARLFFRDYTDHLQNAIDYSLVWPTAGLMHVPRKDLLQRRQSSLVKAIRTNPGWDIPRHGRPLSSGSIHMLPASPSIYHRPPSTTSNGSSRASSWKPSWSWFGNGSRTHLNCDELSNRSDSKTMQTSWNSLDFADLREASKDRSPRSWSRERREESQSPCTGDAQENAPDGGEESDSVTTTIMPSDQLDVRKNEDGTVQVALLDTVSMLPGSSSSADTPHVDEAQSEFPLTGVLARFHPDMLLQAIPYESYNEAQLKNYLSEEDLYMQDSISAAEQSWLPMASVTIVELGGAWRLRKLTRMTRTIDFEEPEVLSKSSHEAAGSNTWRKSDVPKATLYEESWHNEVLTSINEDLMRHVGDSIEQHRQYRDTASVQHLIDTILLAA